MSESRKILAAVAVGAAAGLVAGLLFAPDKGSKTRKRIADTSRKMTDNVKDVANQGLATMNKLKNKMSRKADEIHNDVNAEETVW